MGYNLWGALLHRHTSPCVHFIQNYSYLVQERGFGGCFGFKNDREVEGEIDIG